MNKPRRTLFGLTCVFLLATNLAWGQAGTTSIRGAVPDPQAKPVPGATITIRNIGTGLTRTQTSSSAGDYSFEFVPPGEYSLEIEASGFKKKILNVRALVGSPTDASAELELG